MPNHTTTRCVVTGPADAVAAFKSRCIVTKIDKDDGQPFETFDFNSIIPMPAICLQVEESSVAEDAARLIFLRGMSGAPFDFGGLYDRDVKRIYRETDSERDEGFPKVCDKWLKANPEAAAKGDLKFRCIAETGYSGWYSWSIANWATKWNAYSFHECSDNPGRYEFTFMTAWDFPTPVFAKMATEFPDLKFQVWTHEEGEFFDGRGFFNLGPDDLPFEKTDPKDETLHVEIYTNVFGHSPDEEEDEDDGIDEEEVKV